MLGSVPMMLHTMETLKICIPQDCMEVHALHGFYSLGVFPCPLFHLITSQFKYQSIREAKGTKVFQLIS